MRCYNECVEVGSSLGFGSVSVDIHGGANGMVKVSQCERWRAARSALRWKGG